MATRAAAVFSEMTCPLCNARCNAIVQVTTVQHKVLITRKNGKFSFSRDHAQKEKTYACMACGKWLAARREDALNYLR